MLNCSVGNVNVLLTQSASEDDSAAMGAAIKKKTEKTDLFDFRLC